MYPDYIMENVRNNLGLDSDDTSSDKYIEDMDPLEVLERFWIWEGIIGYAELIKDSVCDIYGIDLETRDFYEVR